MKTLKIMSIIGITLFSLMLVILIHNQDVGSVGQGQGMGGIVYGLVFSIVVLIHTNKYYKK